MSTPSASTNGTFYRLSDVAREEVSPQLSRRLISGERLMMAQVELKSGCLVPAHAHVHEQITYVVDGWLRLSLGDDLAESYDLRAGDVLHIPSNVRHSGEAQEDTRVIDLFSPPREDWLQKTDAYLRR